MDRLAALVDRVDEHDEHDDDDHDEENSASINMNDRMVEMFLKLKF